MTLFWFLLGLALIVGIARYNESNKLFWALFCSLLIGIACGHIIGRCTATGRNVDKIQIQKHPTHGLYCASDTMLLSLADDTNTALNTMCKRVSKDIAFENENFRLSKRCCLNTAYNPQTIKPPWNSLNILTPPDCEA